MERKLASVRVIDGIRPIEGADKIELAIVDGWQCIVEKNKFRTNDKIIYVEIDSFLPVEPYFEFLRKSSFKVLPDGREGFRLRTIRMRGEISQGLVLPISLLQVRGFYGEPPIGLDVTDIFEITKYEPPIPASLAGKVRGSWPSYFPKTDEERVQNVKFADLSKPRTYFVTEKLDGTSFTAFMYNGELGVCSRNLHLEEDDANLYWQVAKQNHMSSILLNKNWAIQGEIIGPGIQKNRYRIVRPTLFVFGIFDIDARCYLPFDQVQQYADLMGFRTVPLIEKVTLSISTPEEKAALIASADGPSVITPEVIREGIVYKSYEDGQLGAFSFKAISNKFLIQEE